MSRDFGMPEYYGIEYDLKMLEPIWNAIAVSLGGNKQENSPQIFDIGPGAYYNLILIARGLLSAGVCIEDDNLFVVARINETYTPINVTDQRLLDLLKHNKFVPADFPIMNLPVPIIGDAQKLNQIDLPDTSNQRILTARNTAHLLPNYSNFFSGVRAITKTNDIVTINQTSLPHPTSLILNNLDRFKEYFNFDPVGKIPLLKLVDGQYILYFIDYDIFKQSWRLDRDILDDVFTGKQLDRKKFVTEARKEINKFAKNYSVLSGQIAKNGIHAPNSMLLADHVADGLDFYNKLCQVIVFQGGLLETQKKVGLSDWMSFYGFCTDQSLVESGFSRLRLLRENKKTSHQSWYGAYVKN
jgi:hypothetical protein